MKSIVSAKKKVERRYMSNLWGNPNSSFAKREYAPGQHGQRRKKQTDYGEQLYAKQRLKTYYGNVSEKQFHKYYVEAVRRTGDAAENLVGILESRLDNLVWKSKFVPTIFAARQFVNHGHVLVNGKKVNIPSYIVKAGDVIEVREKSKQLPVVLAAIESTNRDFPGYLEVDSKKLTAKYSFVPKFDDIPYACQQEPNLVIEFYSR
ncbi:MAG: 30S ribosomal protein S4 [Alphaproteobacteria bacterium]|nr:30S ribosomal protein S4 [Alphaproteobacteria bacterium]MBQ8631065.1 30S ribosomal protein S4 [Alphaproteobacteria bacterium]